MAFQITGLDFRNLDSKTKGAFCLWYAVCFLQHDRSKTSCGAFVASYRSCFLQSCCSTIFPYAVPRLIPSSSAAHWNRQSPSFGACHEWECWRWSGCGNTCSPNGCLSAATSVRSAQWDNLLLNNLCQFRRFLVRWSKLAIQVLFPCFFFPLPLLYEMGFLLSIKWIYLFKISISKWLKFDYACLSLLS